MSRGRDFRMMETLHLWGLPVSPAWLIVWVIVMADNKPLKSLPLQQVYCEIRFPGDPEVEALRGKYFREIRSEFPSVFVPEAQEGQAMPLQPYRFVAADNRVIGIALNSFYYGVTGEGYESFELFKNSFKNYWTRFCGIYSFMEGLTRVGLRYINHLPIERGVRGEIVSMPLRLPMAIDAEIRNTLRVSEYQISDGVIRVVVDTTQNDLVPHNLALLDLDFTFSANLDGLLELSEIDNRLDQAHDGVKNSLRSLISQDYAQEVGIL
jgi:uncharacterized protein (TIGR04255 family)